MTHVAALLLRIAARAAARLYDDSPSHRNVRTEMAYCDLLRAANAYEAAS